MSVFRMTEVGRSIIRKVSILQQFLSNISVPELRRPVTHGFLLKIERLIWQSVGWILNLLS